MSFDYSLDYRNIDFRKNPELYRIGRGEQGVLSVEPYKSEILPYWRFRTPEIARESSEKIYQIFLQYKKNGDFVGMDMARKFLQMGYTRSRRYANHPSGRKYSDEMKDDITPPLSTPEYKSERNKQHFLITKTKKVLPQAPDAFTSEKAECARIFYEKYLRAKSDPLYQKMKEAHPKD